MFVPDQHRIDAHILQGRFTAVNDGSLVLVSDGGKRFGDVVLCVLEAKRSVDIDAEV